MGFHKRHINNQQVIDLYKSGGVENVIKWYTGKVDALILETGLASNINSILCDHFQVKNVSFLGTYNSSRC